MKKTCFWIVVILLCIGCVYSIAEEQPTTYTSGDYQYILLSDGTAEITRYKGTAVDLDIQPELDGHTVTSIGDAAFFYCRSLMSVTIPDRVAYIGNNPFLDCENLSVFKVSPDHPVLAVVDGVLFSKSDKRIVCYPKGKKGTEYAIPQGIQLIGEDAFYCCDSLMSVMIPDSVTRIGEGAFSGCDSLTSITLPDSVTSIGDRAFYYCTDLTSVTIPDSVTSIGVEAFSSCYSLTNITIPDSVSNIGTWAFSYCSSLKSITVPDSVTTIGVNPFIGCKNLSGFKISPNHPALAVIDGVLFSKLDKRIICYPNGKKGTEYAIPQGIQLIGEYAFYWCDSLKSITIPDSVTSIGDSAFDWCDSLTSIMIPDSVTGIGDEAFYGCSRLMSVTISDGVTSIGDKAFSDCNNLTSITIPDSVTTIGVNPFIGCKNLSVFKISPEQPALNVIDGVLFSKSDKRIICYPNGKKGTEYAIPQGIQVINEDAFYQCDSLKRITIPDSVTSIGSGAFSWCDNLTSVTIPNSVTSIGSGAFSWCDNLTITVSRDSYAAQYCQDNNLNYTYPDFLDWLNN